jgi:O-acetyl-ADP-ribose deacetylase (regulator of RNase III)
MEIGSNMMYPNQVIDGIVHRLGGNALSQKCKNILKSQQCVDGKLPLGTAVVTSCKDIQELETLYDFIIHTTPPFYPHYNGSDSSKNHDHEIEVLKKCYTSSFHRIEEFYRQGKGKMGDEFSTTSSLWETVLSWMNGKSSVVKNHDLGNAKTVRIGIPLIGAGARGFPSNVAVHVAATQSVSWMKDHRRDRPMDSLPHEDGNRDCVVAFGIPDPQIADGLVTEIRQQIQMMDP